MDSEQFWYDSDLIFALSTLSISDHSCEVADDEYTDITLHVDLDPIHVQSLLEDRASYLEIATGEQLDTEDVVEHVVAELGTALDIEYNTVGFSPADDGQYKRVNERQWSKKEDGSVYDAYSDILYELTGRDVNFDEHHPSVPGLYEPFLQAVAESDDHELPPPGAVREIITQHISDLRTQNQSRAAVSALKRELEQEGINPRSATRVASNMEDLLVSDTELPQTNTEDSGTNNDRQE